MVLGGISPLRPPIYAYDCELVAKLKLMVQNTNLCQPSPKKTINFS